MADEKFKLPRSSYEELTKIVKTYGHLSEAATLREVSQVVGMGETVVSANNAFLIQVEILEKGQKKQVTPKGRDLAQALEHEMPDEIRRNWRRVVNECEFLEKLVASVRIRKGMDDSTLQAHIAYSAGEAKKAAVMTGARAVVDILRAAEVIEDVDGKFVVTSDTNDAISVAPGLIDTATPQQQTTTVTSPSATVTAIALGGTNLQINVDVRVDCQFSDLDDLGPKLLTLIKTLKESANDDNSSDEGN